MQKSAENTTTNTNTEAEPGKPIPKDSGLLALIYEVHTNTQVRDRFRDIEQFDAVMSEFKIDAKTSAIILSLGMTGSRDDPKRKAFADKEIYMSLLTALYTQQLGKDEHFTFGW
ncbi:MAG TPA: hypothetical protein VER33_16215 [Polyangiaceae bacterium]|nr:hypothetical protein [Polyangiaceae bacterium]